MSSSPQELKKLSLKVNELAESYHYREAILLSNKLLELGGHDKLHYFFRAIWLFKVGDTQSALSQIESAIKFGMNDLAAKTLHAKLLLSNKKFNDCVIYCERVMHDAPAVFGNFKGHALSELGRKSEALEFINKIIQRDDCQTVDVVDLFLTLAAQSATGLDYIIPASKFLLPKYEMFNAWGNQELWYQDALRKSLRLVLEGDNPLLAAPRVMNALYVLGDTEYDEVFRWHKLAADALSQQKEKAINNYDHKKIRIGFVSADFRNHSVAYFLRSLYRFVDLDKFQIYSYHTNEIVDEHTYFFEERSTKFYFAGSMSDKELFEVIKQDQIDVLVDLSGYTSGHRLRVFGHRAAPVQVTWLGYPGTTAIRNMDYRIVDLNTDPLNSKEIYTEQLVRLNRLFIAYEPPIIQPVNPKIVGNEIIFGCFNTLQKFNAETIDLWAQLLNEVKNSKLIFKSKGLNSLMIQSRILKMFSVRGVDQKRIKFMPRDKDKTSHLERYNEIDLALDTYPYSGTTTTCEALYMGVPVLSIVGESHRSRVSYSILKALGLEGFASSRQEFVGNVKKICENKSALNQLKKQLRERFLNSMVCDGNAFSKAWFGAIEKIVKPKSSKHS